MLKLTKTGIGLLTRQYRSVLKKCFLINAGLFLVLTPMETEASGLYQITLTTPGGWPSQIDPTDSYASRTFQVTVSAENETSAITQAKKIFSSAWRYDVNTQHYYNDYIISGMNFISTIGTQDEGKMFNEFNNYVMNSENWAISSTVTDFSAFLTSATAANIYQTKLNSNNKLNTSYIDFSSSQNAVLNSGITQDLVNQISINTGTLATHTAFINELDNNYYRKNKKSKILNGVKEGKIGNEIPKI